MAEDQRERFSRRRCQVEGMRTSFVIQFELEEGATNRRLRSRRGRGTFPRSNSSLPMYRRRCAFRPENDNRGSLDFRLLSPGNPREWGRAFPLGYVHGSARLMRWTVNATVVLGMGKRRSVRTTCEGQGILLSLALESAREAEQKTYSNL